MGSVQIYSNHMQYTVCIFHKKIVILSLWNNIQCCHPTENSVEYTQSTRIECHTATGYHSLPHRSSLGSHWSWPALPSLSSDLQSLGWPSVHSRPPRESVHPLVHHIPTHMYSGTSHNVHSEKQITPHGGKTLSQIDFTVLKLTSFTVHEIITPRDSQSNTTQHNATHPRQLFFKEKMSCLRWNSNPRHSVYM